MTQAQTCYPSGKQWTIRGAGKTADAFATIVEIGGGLRQYESGGAPVLESFALDAICDGAHNMPLVPWPNRIRDGRYSFDGHEYQLGLTEPALHNAIHGFGRWRNWTLRAREPDRLVVGLLLHPQPGYPFTLDVAIEYVLATEGLTITTTATNRGARACPWGFGQHPYFAAGEGAIDRLTLEFDAAERLTIDARQIPTGRVPVAGSIHDFRGGRTIGNLKLDDAFTALARDEEGKIRAWLGSPGGPRIGLWADEHFRYLQLYSGDTLAPERRRRALAIEPMTCAPNAFASGDGLMRLEPGETFHCSWGIVTD
ncbi:MAG TPA: aldose 1-epimerase family protein [Gammaproteobacteria bacterium]|nr:aldose 1-epimerase family protein [Gammaproteobacteria bacterium]